MKKLFYLLALPLCIGLMVACSDDDPDGLAKYDKEYKVELDPEKITFDYDQTSEILVGVSTKNINNWTVETPTGDKDWVHVRKVSNTQLAVSVDAYNSFGSRLTTILIDGVDAYTRIGVIQRGIPIVFNTDSDNYTLNTDGSAINIPVSISVGEYTVYSKTSWLDVQVTPTGVSVRPTALATLYGRTGEFVLASTLDPDEMVRFNIQQNPSYTHTDLEGAWTWKSHGANLAARSDVNVTITYDALSNTLNVLGLAGTIDGSARTFYIDIMNDNTLRIPGQIVSQTADDFVALVQATSNQDTSATTYSYWYSMTQYLFGDLEVVDGSLQCYFIGTTLSSTGTVHDGFHWRRIPGEQWSDFNSNNKGASTGTSRFENTIIQQ